MVIPGARNFGSARVDVFELQLNVLTSQYRAATGAVALAGGEQAADPAMLACRFAAETGGFAH